MPEKSLSVDQFSRIVKTAADATLARKGFFGRMVGLTPFDWIAIIIRILMLLGIDLSSIFGSTRFVLTTEAMIDDCTDALDNELGRGNW